MPGPYLRHSELRYKIFSDVFPRNNVLQDWWSIPVGEFDPIRGGLRVLSPGEIVYAGENLTTDVMGNYAVGIHFVCVESMKIEIRGRRTDSQNYVSFTLDFEAYTVTLSETIAGVTTVLQTQSHLLSNDPILYSVVLLMDDDVLIGFINGAYIIGATTSYNPQQNGFSVYVPEIWENIITSVNDITAFETTTFPDAPTIPNDPTDIPQQFRIQLRNAIESPVEISYAAFSKVRQAWEHGKNFGRTNLAWSLLGYHIYAPYTEDWFNKP